MKPGSRMTRAVAALRTCAGAWKYFHQLVCVAFALFALWAAGPGIPEDNLHLGVFTLVMWVMSFLVYPGRKGVAWKAPDTFDWGVALFTRGRCSPLRYIEQKAFPRKAR